MVDRCTLNNWAASAALFAPSLTIFAAAKVASKFFLAASKVACAVLDPTQTAAPAAMIAAATLANNVGQNEPFFALSAAVFALSAATLASSTEILRVSTADLTPYC